MLLALYLERIDSASLNIVHERALDAAMALLTTEPIDLILLNDRLPPYKSYRAPLSQLLAAAPACPSVLLSDELPADFGLQPIDRRLRGVWRKEELSPRYLEDRLADVLPAWPAAA
ncbi:MAG: hypothetical protein AAF719_06390 [Pseudomonadota bacterium]